MKNKFILVLTSIISLFALYTYFKSKSDENEEAENSRPVANIFNSLISKGLERQPTGDNIFSKFNQQSEYQSTHKKLNFEWATKLFN